MRAYFDSWGAFHQTEVASFTRFAVLWTSICLLCATHLPQCCWFAKFFSICHHSFPIFRTLFRFPSTTMNIFLSTNTLLCCSENVFACSIVGGMNKSRSNCTNFQSRFPLNKLKSILHEYAVLGYQKCTPTKEANISEKKTVHCVCVSAHIWLSAFTINLLLIFLRFPGNVRQSAYEIRAIVAEQVSRSTICSANNINARTERISYGICKIAVTFINISYGMENTRQVYLRFCGPKPEIPEKDSTRLALPWKRTRARTHTHNRSENVFLRFNGCGEVFETFTPD